MRGLEDIRNESSVSLTDPGGSFSNFVKSFGSSTTWTSETIVDPSVLWRHRSKSPYI
ncbi:1345_t:CDS:2 [Rhizophagus irregularis]|nr:1345_t:CDS:2 [Rhizophagus irregularis]